MKLVHSLFAAFIATLAITAAGLADEVVEHKAIVEIAVTGDDASEAIAQDVSELAVGESRQIFTESGKEVVITRTDEGYDLEVDGKEIDVSDGSDFTTVTGDHETKVLVKHIECEGEAEDCNKSYHFIQGDGYEVEFDDDVDWEDADDHIAFLALGDDDSAAERLEASGVLDDLSDAKRQEILDALRSNDHKVEKRFMVIPKHDGEDED